MLKTIYDVTIHTITPLHIGSGHTLAQDFDYAVHNRQTWVINQDRLAEYLYDQAQPGPFQQMLQATPPGQLLQPADFQPGSPLFRYVMPGVPRGRGPGTAVKAHIKSIHDQPYLPGSSLKGALRTLLLQEAFRRSGQTFSLTQLNNSRKRAARRLEQDLLGQDAHHDLLRALHLADTAPLPVENLVLFNAQVFSPQGGAPIPLECVRGDATFTTTLTIDDYLFREAAARTRHFSRQRTLFTNLAAIANEDAHKRIQQEATFYQAHPHSRAAGIYRQLTGLMHNIPADSFLLQVGWGGGWHSKTISAVIPPLVRDALVQDYKLSKGQHRPGKPFPQSRRAVARGRYETAEPLAPLGWLLVELNQRREP